MSRFFSYLFLLLLGIPCILDAQKVLSVTIDGSINPVSAEFIHNSIEKAIDQKAECLVIRLNTPGGLLNATRQIVNDMLESTVPLVVYVSPQGAHAGSAGVFITLAAHVAAMAPVTNMGAAHPVGLQGGVDSIMNEKATNDASAFIRAIAAKRKRDMQWAELAVRHSVALNETEALEKKVIDLVASSERELLDRIDGRTIELPSRTVTLHTRNATIENIEMGIFARMLDTISDPNVTYVFLLLGLFGTLFELFNPGAILPGIVGVICLILAFYSMNTLPVNYAGLALIIFGIILFLLEIKIISHGLLAIGGIVSLLLGSLMLIRTTSTLEVVQISRAVILITTAVSALFFLFVIGVGLKAQKGKPVTGIDGLIGQAAQAASLLNPQGLVRVHGEVWNAESVGASITEGEKVNIIGIKDLTLYVDKATGSSAG